MFEAFLFIRKIGSLIQLLGREVRNLSVTHNNQLAVLAFYSFLQALLGQQDAGINLLLQLLQLHFTHILLLYILHILRYDNESTTSLISSFVP